MNEPTQKLLSDFLPEAEAIEIQAPPKSRKITMFALLICITTVLVWASISEIDKLVISRGYLISPVANMVIQPLESGILTKVNAKVGQLVKKGDVLARLDPTLARADLSQYGLRKDILALQVSRLEAELEGSVSLDNIEDNVQNKLQNSLLVEQQATYTAKLKNFESAIKVKKASLKTNQMDQDAQKQRLKSLTDIEDIYLKLESNQYATRTKILEVQSLLLEVKRDYTYAVNREKELILEIEKAEFERSAFIRSWKHAIIEKLSSTMQELNEIKEQYSKAELRAKMVDLTAPKDGVVLSISDISEGFIVQNSEKLFELVPTDSNVEVEVEVSPSDIGIIRKGDKARIKIDAYPFQKFGYLEGEVTTISADAFSRQTSIGVDYYYLIRIKLLESSENQLKKPFRLLPGMTLSGEIVTGKRTIISFFLYPIIRAIDESFREN